MTATDDQVERVQAPTERRNDLTTQIDRLDTIGVLRALNAEDARVAGAVAEALTPLAAAVDLAVARWRAGGRIHYFGAGTSGRIGLMDAVELPSTFGIDAERVVAHHAGGMDAVSGARQDAEDSEALGRAEAAGVQAADVALGLTASGRTPYVAGALTVAKERGAATVLVTANPLAPLASLVDVHVGVDTGAEALTGSTRLKAGTAQKLVLNAFSTALMVRLGKTYSNLMVGVVASNAKLRGRVLNLLEEATGAPEDRCAAALAAARGDTPVALVSLLADVDAATATTALRRCDGAVRPALDALLRARNGDRP